MRKTAHNRIEMAGKIFNSWLVLEVDAERSAGKALYWKCKCLECGNVHSVWGANLRSGVSKRCIACGCGHGHSAQIGQVRTKRTPLESAHHYLFNRLKKDARKRGQSWNLTRDVVRSLVSRPCFYCNLEPALTCSPLANQGLAQERAREATFLRNGIDRLNSAIGYEPGNVVTACETCNKAKLVMSVEEFKAWAERLYNHFVKKPA